MSVAQGNVQPRSWADLCDADEREDRRIQAMSNPEFVAQHVASIPRMWTDDYAWGVIKRRMENGSMQEAAKREQV